MLGASNIWWVPLSNWAGRRPVLIVATLILTLCTMWCGLATSFDSLLAARFFQGVGGGAADTVAPVLIGDVYFVHERGRAMVSLAPPFTLFDSSTGKPEKIVKSFIKCQADSIQAVYTFFLAAGSIVGGIAGGYAAFQLGWAYNFWICTALAGAVCLGTILVVPETLYDRPAQVERASTPSDDSGSKKEGGAASHIQVADSYRPFTFGRSLGFGPIRGNLVSLFIQPWRTLALPGTWVVMLHYAGLVGGIVTISVVGAQLVSMPPYLWGASAGLINIGGLVGTALATVYTFLVSDARLKSQAKHDAHGLAEPEDRLPTMFPPLAIATGGFFVFGFCGQYPGGTRWVGLEVGFAMVAFGLMQAPSIGFNYVSLIPFLSTPFSWNNQYKFLTNLSLYS